MRQLGYTGKTPHRGDFVRHNVPALLHDRWDDWLSTTLLEAEHTIADWPAGYDAVPVWRFAFSADIAGEDARAGILIASRDSVGRRYPFTVFATLDGGTTPLDALADDAPLDPLESLAREALADGARYDTLKASLEALQHAMAPPADDVDRTSYRAGSATLADEPAVYCEDALLLQDRAGTRRLLDAVLRQGAGPYSVWRRSDTPSADGRLIVTGGLPQGGAALALLGTDWPPSAGGRLDGCGRTDTRRPGASLPNRGTLTMPAPPAPEEIQTTRTPLASDRTRTTRTSSTPDATPTTRRSSASDPVPATRHSDVRDTTRPLGTLEPAPSVDPSVDPSVGPAIADAGSAELDRAAVANRLPPDSGAAGRDIAEALGIDEDEDEDEDAPWDAP